jgi:hypothetical protein
LGKVEVVSAYHFKGIRIAFFIEVAFSFAYVSGGGVAVFHRVLERSVRGNCDIQVLRVGNNVAYISLSTFDFAAYDSNQCAFVWRNLGDLRAFDFSVSGIHHLVWGRKVSPKLESHINPSLQPLGISWWVIPLPAVIHYTSPVG